MIELLIINSLIIWGVYTSIQEGMIFERIGFLIRGNYSSDKKKKYIKTGISKHQLPEWIKKPLATCPICMSSFYGTPVFWSAYYTKSFLLLFDDFNIFAVIIIYICYVFALAGLNYLILAFMSDD